jgi:hypothetical protein
MSNENQPRVPAGQPGGGEWTGGAAGTSVGFQQRLKAALEQRLEFQRQAQEAHKSKVAYLKQKIADSQARAAAMLRQMRKDERS